MKTARIIKLTECFTLTFLLLVLLGWPSPIQASGPNAGIEVQTLVHDPRVINFFTRQVGVTTIFSASLRVYAAGSNRLVETLTTDSQGQFRLRLRPGSYLIVPDTMWQGRVLEADEIVVGSYEAAHPIKVRVPTHEFAQVTITYERMMGF